MKCPRCQQENPLQAKFCLACGAPVGVVAVTGRSHADLRAEIESLKRSLSEASEQQTATSEILRVISSSLTDTQPAFDTIAATALRLCNAKLCTVFRFDGKLIHLVALHQVSTEGAAAYRDVRGVADRNRVLESPAIVIDVVVHDEGGFAGIDDRAVGEVGPVLLVSVMPRKGNSAHVIPSVDYWSLLWTRADLGRRAQCTDASPATASPGDWVTVRNGGLAAGRGDALAIASWGMPAGRLTSVISCS